MQADSEGRLVPASRYEALRNDVAPLLLMVRGKRECVNGPHDRHAGVPLLPNSTVRTTERAVHETHLTVVGGRPAAVSAMLIKPSTEGYVKPRPDWPVLITVRYLDGSFMSELQSRYLIDTKPCNVTLAPGQPCTIVVDGRIGVHIGASARVAITYLGRTEYVPVLPK